MPEDLNKYLHHLKDEAMPENEKLRLLADFQSILRGFIDMEFGVHPIQQCREHFSQCNLQSPTKTVDSENKRLVQSFLEKTAPPQECTFEKLEK